MQLKGLYTAMITPFDENGELDEAGFCQNLEYQLSCLVDGVVVLGTTGEEATLTLCEKQKMVEMAVKILKGKALVVVGTGTNCTKTTIEATNRAYEWGADAALIVTPYYNKPTQEGLYRHFASICESSLLPFCLYNIQGRTAVNLETKTLERLLPFSRLIAIKDSSGNLLQASEAIEAARVKSRRLDLLCGDDALALPFIAIGASGVISVASNLAAAPMRMMIDAALKGDFETARHLHFQLLPFFKANFIETNPMPIKTAMRLSNRPAGRCRLPLCDLLPENEAALQSILATFEPILKCTL